MKTKINVRPLSNRVVIRKNEPADKTEGGIILPDGAKEKPISGEVVAVGPGKLNTKEDERYGERFPCECKLGETVLFHQYAGTEFTIDGEEFTIMFDSDVMAVKEDTTSNEKK